MSPLSDKDLDRLSREAAEQFDVEGSASGWDQLEKKLDREMPVEEKKRRRRFWWFFFLAIGVGLATWGIFGLKLETREQKLETREQKLETRNSKLESENSQDQITSSNKTGEQGSLVNPPNTSGVDQPNTAAEESRSKVTTPNSDGDKLNNSKEITQDPQPEVLIKAQSRKSLNQKTAQGITNTDLQTKTLAKDQPIVSKSDIPADTNNIAQTQEPNPSDTNIAQMQEPISAKQPTSNSPAQTKIAGKDPSNPENPSVAQNQANPSAPIQANKSGKNPENQPAMTNPSNQPATTNPANQPAITNPSNQLSAQIKELTSKPQKADADSFSEKDDSAAVSGAGKTNNNSSSKGFEFGILGGVDGSTVKFKGMSAPGINLGISAGYRFNKKWSVNTGLIFTEKKYTAYGDDFNPPKGYWTYYVEMDKVDGVCSMWEIPLNIRYDISTSNRSRWFASAGASTYLMKKENYEYYYYYNGEYTNRYRSYPSSEKYFLSIINISGGFERNISQKFSLQIEPYMKIPVKGLGFGNLNLNSFGTNFQLKFHPGR